MATHSSILAWEIPGTEEAGTWDLPKPGIEPVSPAMAGGSFLLRHQRSPIPFKE